MGKPIEPIRIEMPLGIMFQTVNVYLIPGEPLTLIDCGLYSEENWTFFQQELKKHGYETRDLEQVLITHEHRDHIGLLPEIMQHSNALIRAPKSIKEWFERPEEVTKRELDYTKNLLKTLGFPEKQLNQSFTYFDTRPITRAIEEMHRIHFYEEGEHLQIGSADWEVLNTPGHSPAQHVFLQKEQQRIFGSDMLLPVAPMPIPFEKKDFNTPVLDPLPALLDSFERLKTFHIQTVYPGHGKVFSDANLVIDRQLARIEVRKEECYEAVKLGLQTPYQISRKLYPYQNIPPDFSGLFMVLGYLQLLLNEGRIEERDGQNLFSTKAS